MARNLLGKYLVRTRGNVRLIGMIVEVEAYRGTIDPASHAYRGMTQRNEVMFRVGGHLYVYFTYGMHFCMNVVTGKAGVGEAVLIRAIEPIEGISIMRKNRGFGNSLADLVSLTNGPAKVCQALGISRPENGIDLVKGPVFIARGIRAPRPRIVVSTRIGIREGTDRPWRYYIKDNPWVSRYKKSPHII